MRRCWCAETKGSCDARSGYFRRDRASERDGRPALHELPDAVRECSRQHHGAGQSAPLAEHLRLLQENRACEHRMMPDEEALVLKEVRARTVLLHALRERVRHEEAAIADLERRLLTP